MGFFRLPFVNGASPVVKAALNHTTGRGKWQERLWVATPVPVDVLDKGTVVAELPAGTSVYYVNLFTEDGLAVSSEHEKVELLAIDDYKGGVWIPSMRWVWISARIRAGR